MIHCDHIAVRIPGTGPGGFPAMVRAEGYCYNEATRRVTFKNGDVERLCGKHAGIEKRMRHGRGVASEERIDG